MTGASSLLQRRVVVLNSNWTPVNVVSVRKAFALIFTERRNSHAASSSSPTPPAPVSLASWLNPSDMSLHDASSPWAVQELWHQCLSGDTAAYIATPTLRVRVPQAIVLSSASTPARPRTRQLLFTRRAVLQRDRYSCAYCGDVADTIDHVVARSDGGRSCFANCVACCSRCNLKKGRKSLQEAGLRVRHGVRLIPPEPDSLRQKRLLQYNEYWLDLLESTSRGHEKGHRSSSQQSSF
jgi:5-methylcytosine-specific restriction endonuclease McrA